MIEEYSISIKTNNNIELIDITSKIKEVVSSSKIRNGLINVFSPHTTTAIFINESESRLINDLENGLYQLIDWKKDYQHNQIDRNAPAHLLSAYIGCQKTINISANKLRLGTWQAIFFIELDGPRHRLVDLQILGE